MDPKRFEGQQKERYRGYLTVVIEHEEIDVCKAVDNFIAGKVRNFNPAFCPTAPQLATHIREVRDKRLDLDHWDTIAKRNAQQLPPPEKSEQSRQRVREMMKDFANKHSLGPKTATETPEQAQDWLNEHQRTHVAAGVEKSAGGALKSPTGTIPVTPVLRENLKRHFPIDG